MLTKQEHLSEKACAGREQEGEGTRKDCAPRGSVSGFVVRGLGAGHSDSGLFRGEQASLRMDPSEKDSGSLARHMNWHLLCPLDLF